jgi:hypothetical protein
MSNQRTGGQPRPLTVSPVPSGFLLFLEEATTTAATTTGVVATLLQGPDRSVAQQHKAEQAGDRLRHLGDEVVGRDQAVGLDVDPVS